jgi:hypothetical protein
MLSQYGSFRQQLADADWSVSVLSGGSLSANDTIEFFVQAHNRVGLNKLSTGKQVTTSANSKIRLTINSLAIASGEDTFKFVVSARRGAETPKQVAEIYVRESNQYTFKQLPISVDFVTPSHVSTNLAQALSDGDNRINGQIRIVEGVSYRYDNLATSGEFESSPGYWVLDSRFGIVSIDNTRGQYGADQRTSTANLVIPARLNTEGEIRTEPIIFWWSNNLDSNLGNFSPAGMGLNLKIYLNGALTNSENIPYGNLFSNLITIRFLGYVNIATGTINTALQDVNVEKLWTPTSSGMTLPANLESGYAAAYGISVEFSGDLLATMVATGGTVGIELTREPTPGVYEPSTGVLGDSVLDGLYVLPEQMLPGVATLNNYRVTYRTPSFFVGLEPDTSSQKVIITNSPNGLAMIKQGELGNGEYLRAIVGTLPGTQSISEFSDPQYVTSNNSILLTINYPVNADGLGTVRGDYPDLIAGNSSATFNVPNLIIYLHDTYNDIYYQVPTISVVSGESQQITISELENATEIDPEDLPSSSSNFGLFGYLDIGVADSGVVGSIPFNLFRVAIAYHYPEDNLAITSVSHATSQGCLPQVRGALVDSLENNLYWLTPATTVATAKAIAQDKLLHGAVLLVIDKETLYRYDSDSVAISDDDLVIRPTVSTGAGRFIALASGTGSGGLGDVGWNVFAKGELITWTGSEITLLPRGQDGYYLKSDDSSPSGLTWAEVTGGGSLTFPLNEAAHQVLHNTSTGVVDLKPMWSSAGIQASPSSKCLVFANASDPLLPHYFNVVLTPSGTVKSALLFDPVQEAYSWSTFTVAGLLDTYDTGTTIPHNSQLIYDAAIQKWIPGVGRVETTLTNLLDTFIESPSNNYPLVWDALTGKFIISMPELSAIEGLSYTISSVAVPGDTQWSNTKVLVSARSPGQDLRGTLESVAVFGATVTNASPYINGATSYNFQRTSRQSLQIETSSDTLLAGNTFAMEMFFNSGELTSGLTYALASRNNDVETDFALLITETTPEVFNVVFFGYSTGPSLEIDLSSDVEGGLQPNTWYHIAVTRNGNNWRLFLDGQLQEMITSGATLTSGFAYPSQIFITIGRINGLPTNDDTQFVGKIEDFRLTIGNARYLANFTPPTIPLPVSQGGTRNVKDYFISFAGLTDVDETVEPEEDYVPAWSTVKGKYVPKPIGAGGEVVTLSLNQLSNVNVGAAATDYFLAKDSDGVWRGRVLGSGVTSINGMSGVVSLNTDDIEQGTTNLYLTPGAIAAELAESNLEQLANVQSTIANNLYLQKVNGVWQGASVSFPVTGVNSKTGNITLTTSDIAEGTRLYYTDARVTARIEATSINAFSDVNLSSPSTDQVLIYSGSAFINQGLSTSVISEGTNLYYTNARVATHVNTLSIANFGGVFTGTPVTGKIVSVDANGKLTFIDAPSGTGLTNTDALTEGSTNLYYTNARVATHVNTLSIANFSGVFTGTPVTGKIVSVDANGKLIFIDGPSGLTNTDGLTEGSTNLYYTNARVATHVNTLSIANFSGVFTGTPVTGKIVSVDANGKLTFIDAPSALTNTDGLTEGSTNLYYTNARVATHVNTLSIANFGGVFTGTPVTGKIVSVDANGKLTFIDAPSGSGLTNTDGLTEGSANLYYTNARVATHVNTLSIANFGGVFTGTPVTGKIVSVDANGKLTFIDAPSGSGLTNTDGLTEGSTNLYYTNARVATHVNTLSIANFEGVFSGSTTEGYIPVVNATGKLALSPRFPSQEFREVTGNHTVEASDLGKIIRISNTSTVTLPSGLPNGFQVTIFNETNSTITLTSAGTIKAKALTCPNQYGAIYATHVSSNTWIVVGDLS